MVSSSSKTVAHNLMLQHRLNLDAVGPAAYSPPSIMLVRAGLAGDWALLNFSAKWHFRTMPTPRESSARALNRKQFEAAMRSEAVEKLILENATSERISAPVNASPSRVRSWLRARGLLTRARDCRAPAFDAALQPIARKTSESSVASAWRGKKFWAKAVKAKLKKRKPRSVGLKPPVAPDNPLRNSDGLVLAGNHGRRNPINERTLEMDELHKEGCSYRELARRYGLSDERVSQLIRQLHRKQREDKANAQPERWPAI
jgi:hypothetical protein